ncbi:MAG: hypothetical protein AAGG81_01675 [Chlamydiota bacterium]
MTTRNVVTRETLMENLEKRNYGLIRLNDHYGLVRGIAIDLLG